jgi:hypothetical protein
VVGWPQLSGGIAISGLPANLAFLNATYAPTGELVAGYPAYSAGPEKHLYRHPEEEEWQINDEPFDPATDSCCVYIHAAGGPVPTGARAWQVCTPTGTVGSVSTEVTAREVDVVAAVALEAQRAAAAVAQGKRVVRPPPRAYVDYA